MPTLGIYCLKIKEIQLKVLLLTKKSYFPCYHLLRQHKYTYTYSCIEIVDLRGNFNGFGRENQN